MKKIFLVSFAMLSLIVANAQNDKASASKATPAGEPLVNGIPYSQYKAQQDALKNKQQVTPAVVTAPVTVVDAKSIRTATVTQTPVTTATPVKTEIVVDKTASTAPAQLVPMPKVNIATGTDAQSAAVSTPVNTGVKVEQSKVTTTPVEEIKPSVTTPAPKVPVVPMQKAKE